MGDSTISPKQAGAAPPVDGPDAAKEDPSKVKEFLPNRLEYCSEEVKKYASPYTACAPPTPDRFIDEQPDGYRRYITSGEHYAIFSLYWNMINVPIPLWGNGNQTPLTGGGILFRPHRYFGLGAELDGNHRGVLQFLGRIQTSFNLDEQARSRITPTLLGGFEYVGGQERDFPNPDRTLSVTGILPKLGGQLAFDIRLLREQELCGSCDYGTWGFSISPHLSVLYTFPEELTNNTTPGQSVEPPPAVQILLGARLALDLWYTGE